MLANFKLIQINFVLITMTITQITSIHSKQEAAEGGMKGCVKLTD